jgi:hypothetical protein
MLKTMSDFEVCGISRDNLDILQNPGRGVCFPWALFQGLSSVSDGKLIGNCYIYIF